MKRIFFILAFLVLTFWVKAQYPIPQNIGSPNTLVQVPANGGFRAAIANRNFTDTTEANASQIDAYPGSQIFTSSGAGQFWVRNSDATRWIDITSGGGGSSGTPFNGCISGCTVTWIENYDYEVAPSVYYINGVRYESLRDTVTLDASDPDLDRIDVFVVDTNGLADKVTGVADTIPIEPSVNALSQLRISFALVTSGSTEPTISNLWIYRENDGCDTEWDFSTSAPSINLASINNPYAGTKDIEATNMSTLQKFEGYACDSVIMRYDALVFKIRSKGTWANNRGLQISFINDSTGQSSAGVLLLDGRYGFNSSITNVYQNVTIPLPDFGAQGLNGFNHIVFQRTNIGGTIGFYLDDIQLLDINDEQNGSQLQGLQDVILFNNVFTQNNVTELNGYRWDFRQGKIGIQVSTNGYADLYGTGGGDLNIDVARIFTTRIDLNNLRVSQEIGLANNSPITSYSGHIVLRPDQPAYSIKLTSPNSADTTNPILQFQSTSLNDRIGEIRAFNNSNDPSVPFYIYTAGASNSVAGNMHLRTGVTLTTVNAAQETYRYSNTQFGNTDIYLEPARYLKLKTPDSTFSPTYALTYNLTDSSVRMINVDSLVGGIAGITADNGLTANTATNVRLGGTLSTNTTIATGSNTLTVNTATGGVNPFKGEATTGIAIWGQATSGNGFYGSATSGFGVYGTVTTGIAIYGEAGTSGLAASLLTFPSSTNTVTEVARFTRATTGTASDNIGGSIDLYLEADDGNFRLANQLISKWTTAANATRTSQFIITGVNSAVTGDIAYFNGSGMVGIGSSTASATRLNIVDNTITTTNMVALSSTSLSSGSLMDLSVNSTGAASNTQTALNITTAGANGTATQTTYGIRLTNTHTGSTSTNYGGHFTSSGATTNVGAYGTGATFGVQGVTTSGSGVRGDATTGIAVNGLATGGSSYGGYFESAGVGGTGVYGQVNNTSGIGVWGASTVGVGGQFNVNPSSTNTLVVAVNVYRTTSGTAAAGLGGSIDFLNEVDNGSAQIFGRIGTVITDVALATRTGDMVFYTTNSATSGEKLRITGDGRLYGTALHNNAGSVTGTTNQYIASGTYTPTFTDVNGTDASTTFACQWMRVGNVVTVSGRIDVDATTIESYIAFRLSLPIASSISASNQLSGSGSGGSDVANGEVNSSVRISGDATNDQALFEYTTINSGAEWPIFFTFTYVIL